MSTIFFALPDGGNWLVQIIAWLVKITSSVGVGVILFTLILKLLTLPFDFLSRASMRKNSLKMEEMRPELERLQKQYANDKQLYNQKMMALYKKNGYSMWGSCLPTILTLVIFIVAINGFNKYSQFSNQMYFYNMSQSYNQVIYDGFETVDDLVVKDANGDLIINSEKIEGLYNLNGGVEQPVENIEKGLTVEYKINKTTTDNKEVEGVITFWNTNSGYMKCEVGVTIITNKDNVKSFHPGKITYSAIASKLETNEDIFFKNNHEDVEKITFADFKKTEVERLQQADPAVVIDFTKIATDFIKNVSEFAAAETYRAEQDGFLWIKNVWAPDIPWKHPVAKDAVEFNKTNRTQINPEQYNSLTAKLSFEKGQANGYLILVVLTVATSFLSQFITNRSQKAQMELQTVDGQGAQTSKMMMWMMPIMMAVFAFIYTSAFALYIILSSVLGLLTTLLINAIIDRKYKKAKGKDQVVRSKGHKPKEQPKKQEKKKRFSLFEKKEEEPKKDFLSGLADKKKRKK